MILGGHTHGTYCVIDGEQFFVLGMSDGGVRVGGRPDPVPAERVTGVFLDLQEYAYPVRRQFPAPAAFGEVPDRSETARKLVGELGRAVEAGLPEGWRNARVDCTALGIRMQISAKVTTDGEHPWIPTQEVVDVLRRLRDVEYRPDTGAWTTATFTIGDDGSDYRTGHEAPQWLGTGPGNQEYYEELRFFPRVTTPQWLLDAAWSYYLEYLGAPELGRPVRPVQGPVRMVQVFDTAEDDRPVAYRPALPWVEKQLVLGYLSGGEILLSAPGTDPDAIDPRRPPEVPKQFHTDGTWVWPLAMAYYLDEHDIAPPRDFLDHIRGLGYQPPEIVASRAGAEAKALVLGTDADRLESPPPEKAIGTAKAFIGRAMEMSRRFYSFTEPIEGGWSMLREADGWWSVFCVDQGEVMHKSRFPEPYAAAAHLIGAMTLTHDRFKRGDDEYLEDYECQVQPLDGEPPLAAYDYKILTILEPGDEIDRFGHPEGNTVFVAGTTLPQRSIPPQQPPGEYRRFRVLQPLGALTGVAKPDYGQVGGGTVFVLTHHVQGLVAEGYLAEV